MSEDNAMVTMLRQIVDVWSNRNERQAAHEAGSLKFWNDGALQDLRAIASGQATDATFQNLTMKYQATADGVTEATQKLRQLRDRFGGNRLADQIDAVLHSEWYGKMTIRSNIAELIAAHENAARYAGDIPSQARDICSKIDVFNAEIGRLYRMVYDQ